MQKSKSIKELRMGYIPGNSLIVKRFDMPSEDEEGILTADSITIEEENVHTSSKYKPLFQNRGEIVGIGLDVKTGLFELGDVVHLLTNSDLPIYMDKTDSDQWNPGTPITTPYVKTDAAYGVAFVEQANL